MILIAVLRLFDSRQDRLMQDSNLRPSDYRSEALPIEIASLTHRGSSTVDAYMRSDIKAHKPARICVLLKY